ncbi:hypothetical protein ACFQS1_01535 [Paractinoplanes rhizophilus]|uniref:Anti-sigma factor RsiW n=1 Tax=Paractinoplanes rhizophilus TaxID=1416877 RepID=A0ABW2HI51_9ACTN
MRHPSEGTLRRLVDEPDGVPDAARHHVLGCAECRAGLAAAESDADLAAHALHAEAGADDIEAGTDVDAAWRRLSATTAAPGKFRHPGRKLRSPIVAGVAAAVVLAGAGAAAAADWLPIFRAERVTPVVVTPGDLVALPDLSAYGTVELTKPARVRAVDGPAAATEATGLPVPQVGKLPRGVTGSPSYRVGDRAVATFTFQAAKAARTAAAAGKPLPPPPAGMDGSQFRLTAGPGLAAIWAEGHGVPAMVVARVAAPVVYSTGIPFETARDYLLSLPGLPESVATELRGTAALSLIVKGASETTATVDVNGVPATVLALKDGTMAGVVWVDGGYLTGVAGSISADEAVGVARGLRWSR